MKQFALTTMLVLFAFHSMAENPIELGTVHWIRDYEEAITASRKNKKPIFILFQEIPGCNTCVQFGKDVMSNALIVEMIETYFTPLAIYNNKGGKDATVLKKYNEPAWNNPVVRIVDGNGNDLISRLSGGYSRGSVITHIRKGLEANKKLVPAYIQQLEEEYTSIRKELVLEMYCFWSGEKNIAQQRGVIETMPGFSNGREVVKVIYDATATDATTIIRQAKKTQNADAVHVADNATKNEVKSSNIAVKNLSDFKLDGDIHYYLKHSEYAHIYMSPGQATRINSIVGQGMNADHLLSPRQLALLKEVRAKKSLKKDRYLDKL